MDPCVVRFEVCTKEKERDFFRFYQAQSHIKYAEGVARKKNIASEIKISPAISARFQKRGERARSKRVITPDGNLKKVQNEVRTKFLVVSFHVRLSYYRGRKEKKNE